MPQNATEEQIRQVFSDGYIEATRIWKLTEAAARGFALLKTLGWYFDLAPIHIISGRRTAQQQAEMQRLWDAGERAGISVRPASNSAHLTGNAFDTNYNEHLDVYGEVWQLLDPRNVWGGTFREPDRNHFSRRG